MNAPALLSREDFSRAVFERDGNACVVCGRTDSLDPHHILNRRLWTDGGYFLDNGITLCPEHHILAEKTLLTCEELRVRAGIKRVLIPEHLTQGEGEDYDCWGNQLLANGTRLKGELFFDTGCQRMLTEAGLLGTFAQWIKFPRSMHLPWSPNLQNDDRVIQNLDGLKGREVIATEKMDGENTTMYPERLHARSVDSRHHESRNLVKALHARVCGDIPAGHRICGENMYAQHSIAYTDLPSVFLVFNIWDERNVCLDWDTTVAYCDMLGLSMVPVLYRGPWDEAKIRSLEDTLSDEKNEGYVVRIAESITYSGWRRHAAKFVRKAHVRTDEHWTTNWRPNGLRK